VPCPGPQAPRRGPEGRGRAATRRGPSSGTGRRRLKRRTGVPDVWRVQQGPGRERRGFIIARPTNWSGDNIGTYVIRGPKHGLRVVRPLIGVQALYPLGGHPSRPGGAQRVYSPEPPSVLPVWEFRKAQRRLSPPCREETGYRVEVSLPRHDPRRDHHPGETWLSSAGDATGPHLHLELRRRVSSARLCLELIATRGEDVDPEEGLGCPRPAARKRAVPPRSQ
jgi:hypothetical protein